MQPSKPARVEARKLKGFQDHLPTSMRARLKIMQSLRQHAGLAGFQEIHTPALEYAEVLLGVGGETDKQVFRFVDNGDRDVAMRFDLTVPFARFVAEHFGVLSFPFKRMQIGDVWRAEKPQKGRYREFAQCDLDIIGAKSVAADVEVMSCFLLTLDEAIAAPFTMSLGHRSVLSALLERAFGEDGITYQTEILITLDKLHKIGKPAVVEQLQNKLGVSSAIITELLETITPPTHGAPTNLNLVREFLKAHAVGLKSLEDLEAILQNLAPVVTGHGKVLVDLTIARGLGYYTGVVFETTIDALPGMGSICSGGRYDQLAERFIAQDLAGVGGSIGLDRIIAALQELPGSPKSLSTPPATVFVAIADQAAMAYGFEIVRALRAKGVSSDLALKEQKLGAQFKYANRMGFAYVITVGEKEMTHRTLALKEMATGIESKDLPFTELKPALFGL